MNRSMGQSRILAPNVLAGATSATNTLSQRPTGQPSIDLPQLDEPHAHPDDRVWAWGINSALLPPELAVGLPAGEVSTAPDRTRSTETKAKPISWMPDTRPKYLLRHPIERLRFHSRHQQKTWAVTSPLVYLLARPVNANRRELYLPHVHEGLCERLDEVFRQSIGELPRLTWPEKMRRRSSDSYGKSRGEVRLGRPGHFREPALSEQLHPQDDPITILFIVGYPRSGSTILGNTLGEIDGFFHAGEVTHLWDRDLLRRSRRCGCGVSVVECSFWAGVLSCGLGEPHRVRATFRQQRSWVRFSSIPRLLCMSSSSALATPGLGNYLRTLSSLYVSIAKETGASVIVDSSKLAPAAAAVRLLEREGMTVRFVHLVRDPLDVACSRQRKIVASGRKARRVPQLTIRFLSMGCHDRRLGRRSADATDYRAPCSCDTRNLRDRLYDQWRKSSTWLAMVRLSCHSRIHTQFD